MSMHIEWWETLNHGGLLIALNKIPELFGRELDPLSYSRAERLRREITRFDGTSEALTPFLDFLFEELSDLPSKEWKKGQQIEARWSLSSFTKEQIKPRRIWIGPNGETLPVFVPQAGSDKTIGSRLGVGRSRRLLSRVLEWLRRQQLPLALITNGRQLRLVHAGQDYDAWCEWDIDLWFAEGAPSNQVTAWRQLLNRSVLLSPKAETPGILLKAILDSRKGQADLSSVLGERVRKAVEELITASHSAIERAKNEGIEIDYRDLYLAGTRIIMRTIVALFAEARGLLPVDNRIYQQSYSIDGLRQQLDRRASGRGGERLAQGRSAWPRMVSLFNLIYYGSSHEQLPVPQYSGNLFQPGESQGESSLARALTLLESPDNPVTDKQVRQILRLLTRTKVRVRKGRGSTLVDGPVDFAALSTEYIGILYEGLLDYELKQADASDPIIFLNVGRQPALPLSRLEDMDDKTIKQLFEELKTKEKGLSDEEESVDGDEESKEEETQNEEVAFDAADEVEHAAYDTDEGNPNSAEGEEEEIGLSATDLERAQRWLERAAVIAGLVKKPRVRNRGNDIEDVQALQTAAKKLCAQLIAPGEFYLVRWGGTRKGAGTFYTRPQLAGPTVRRTLQPLAFVAVRTEVNPRTGLEDVVEWIPRKPEEILALKICDPAMGSGSFPVSVLRFITDALVQSLYYHQRIERRTDGAVARLADGHALSKDSEESIPLPPDHEGFDDMLSAKLKRHVVERCIYGADIDPLAVELARMALWVETMNRDLPFGFLDHKLKVGNTLVGTWFDTFHEYPAMAWSRDGGDKDYQKDKPERLINHFYLDSKGKKRGDVFTSSIKAYKTEVTKQLINRLSGQLILGEIVEDVNVHEELARVFEDIHVLPVHETEKRSQLYNEKILNNPRYHALKARMDLWCALWFWPGDKIDIAPLPADFMSPSEEALAIVRLIAIKQKFFHWELEYPDVFTPDRHGFDALVGNPPWETMQPNSKEFFSNYDPLYRAYGKQDALVKQLEYFREQPKVEFDWIDYITNFKAFANWMNNVGTPFGETINKGQDDNLKHDINLGGRGKNNFKESERLHQKWRQRRLGYSHFADPRHPFFHQGSGKPYLQKMFLEQSHSLLRDGGRLGMIVPSGVYTDKGTTELRELFLEHCDWQWLFGFENREKVFDIDSRFKFCPLIVQKGGETIAIRAAFMHRNVDDWDQAERHVLAYPRERVEEFSPYSKAILEIRSEQDLLVLQKIYANGVLLGDKSEKGWGIKYQQGDFNLTTDSKLFPDRSKWEQKGYCPDEYDHWIKGPWKDYNGPKNILDRQHGLIISRDGTQAIHVDQIEDVAVPLYEGRMIGQYDYSEKGWVNGKGRSAVWRKIPFDKKVIEPQYLISYKDGVKQLDKGLRPCFMDITSATNSRTMIASAVWDKPCGHRVPLLIPSGGHINALKLIGCLNSFVFDYVLRNRLGGLVISWFMAEECPIIINSNIPNKIAELVFSLISIDSRSFELARYSFKYSDIKKPISRIERLRLEVIIDSVIASLFGLSFDDMCFILSECDYPLEDLSNNTTLHLHSKGFWRLGKNIDPELRKSVLTIIAFHDLQEKGLEAFLNQNEGEGWMIPDTIRLADYGLGHDERAKEYQPVASRLGPRFYDWQLDEDVARSWEECEVHAALIRRIVPIETDTKATESRATPTGQTALGSKQMKLF